MVKFCIHCGTKLDDDSKFCSKCGNLADEISMDNKVKINVHNFNNSKKTEESNKEGLLYLVRSMGDTNKILFIAILAIIIVSCVVSGLYVTGNLGNQSLFTHTIETDYFIVDLPQDVDLKLDEESQFGATYQGFDGIDQIELEICMIDMNVNDFISVLTSGSYTQLSSPQGGPFLFKNVRTGTFVALSWKDGMVVGVETEDLNKSIKICNSIKIKTDRTSKFRDISTVNDGNDPISENDISTYFDVMDVNGDGLISYIEFYNVMSKSSADISTIPLMFRNGDFDGNNFIDYEEFHSVMT